MKNFTLFEAEVIQWMSHGKRVPGSIPGWSKSLKSVKVSPSIPVSSHIPKHLGRLESLNLGTDYSSLFIPF